MTLTPIDRELLELYASADAPVEILCHQEPPPPGTTEGDRAYDAWCEQQLARNDAALALYARGLITVVDPADGRRGDLVELSEKGRAALSRRS